MENCPWLKLWDYIFKFFLWMYWKSSPWLAVQCKHGEGGILCSQQWRGATASILNLTFPLEPVSVSPLLRIHTQFIINSGISTFLWRTHKNCPFLLLRPTTIIWIQCLSKNLWARYKIRPGQRASGVTSGNLPPALQSSVLGMGGNKCSQRVS